MISHSFDFEDFVQTLASLPASEMTARTMREMNRIHGEYSREPRIEFQRALYGRKLARLFEFLRERRVPNDLLPKERAAYQRLMEQLSPAAPPASEQPALAHA
jgi:hypothetical protein